MFSVNSRVFVDLTKPGGERLGCSGKIVERRMIPGIRAIPPTYKVLLDLVDVEVSAVEAGTHLRAILTQRGE